MANKITNTQYYSDIANAIRGKNGLTDTYTPAQMAQAITDIPSGGGEIENIDWTDFDNAVDDINIVLLVRIQFPKQTSINLGASFSRTVNWGDGTEESASAQTITHFYDAPGDYVIIIKPTFNTTAAISWSQASYTLAPIGNVLGIAIGRMMIGNISINGVSEIRRIRINTPNATGTIGLSNHGLLRELYINTGSPKITQLSGFSVLKQDNFTVIAPNNVVIPQQGNNQYIIQPYIPETATSLSMIGSFSGMTNVKSIILPAGINTMQNTTFYNCINLEYVHIKGNITSYPNTVFIGSIPLRALVISNVSAVPSLASSGSLGDTAIAQGYGYIYVPDNLVSQWKAATNWVQYASQIKPLSELPAEFQEG